jgi:uncharacterized protein YktA (UPF0223 family)
MADGLMNNPYLGLLNMGLSPEQAQAQIDERRALEFANMNPQQRRAAGIYQGIAGIGRALGAKDPLLEQASQMRALAQQFDMGTSEGQFQFARALQKAGNIQGSQMAIMQASELANREAILGKTRAETAKTELGVQQEEKLRQELAALPDNATEEDMLRVVRKYGKPGDIMKGIETAQAKRAALEQRTRELETRGQQRLDEIKLQNEGRLDAAKQAGVNQQALAQMRFGFDQQLAQMRADLNLQLFKAKQEATGAKPLAAGLQRAEDTDLTNIQNAISSAETIDRPLQALKDGTLKLGLGQNFANAAKNALGRSDPASQAFADLERSVQAATNIKVSAEKGVQTDKDVLRFAKELEAAYGKNDNKVMMKALSDFKEAALKDAENKKKLINSRRKSQNVGEYDFTDLVTPTAPSNAGWSAVQR